MKTPREIIAEELWGDYKHTKMFGTKKGFIRGLELYHEAISLEADKWHDLRENPEDLPEVETTNCSIDVLMHSENEGSLDGYYEFGFKHWILKDGTIIRDIIAWRDSQPLRS